MSKLEKVLEHLEEAYLLVDDIEEIDKVEIKNVIDCIQYCVSIMNKVTKIKVKDGCQR